MSKILKFKYWVSVPLFLTILLYVYALLPERVGILYSKAGTMIYETTKSSFFYSFFGIFILTNGLIYIYQKMLLPKNQVTMQSFGDLSLPQKTYHWLTGLSVIFNSIYIFSVLYIGLYNSRDVDPNHYVTLVYIGPVSLIAWFFYYLYLRLFNK